MGTPEIYSIGALAAAIVALLAWVLRDKSKVDTRALDLTEKTATALEKSATSNKELAQSNRLLAENVRKNTETTEKVLLMLTKVLKIPKDNL